eukprot:405887_1
MAKQRLSYYSNRMYAIAFLIVLSWLLFTLVLIHLLNHQLSISWITNKNLVNNNNMSDNVKTSRTNQNLMDKKNMSCLISEMLSNLTVLKENSIYRVGNLLYQWGPGWNWDILKVKGQSQFNETILRKYFLSASIEIILSSHNKFNVSLLKHIIDEYIINHNMLLELPSDDELVVHIRIGDVIRDSPFVRLITETLSKYSNINKITFVTAMHFGNDMLRGKYIYTESAENDNRKYLRILFTKIIKLFPNMCYKLVSNKNIDKDMIYLSKAKYLIRDRGTFDHVITQLNDNVIINKYNDTVFFDGKYVMD